MAFFDDLASAQGDLFSATLKEGLELNGWIEGEWATA
jgi:hypothetical protein